MSAPTVSLTGVTVFYGEVIGLSHVELHLEPGITGIVGPNGSGKTTLMRCLTGLVFPREGEVRVLGQSPFDHAEVRSRITFVPANESFYENVSARRNLEIAFLARGEPRRAAVRLASEALRLVALEPDANRRYGTWSRGMRQRLKLGLALAAGAEVVLLDEPFLGVDPPSRHKLKQHIAALGEAGRTVLMSSHVLHEIETLTDRVGVLAHGRLLGFGRIRTLLAELRDRHPHRVRLEADRPRQLAAALLPLPHVREVRLLDEDMLELVTERPDVAYRDLARVVAASGAVVRRVETQGDSLEALFEQVTAAGARRL